MEDPVTPNPAVVAALGARTPQFNGFIERIQQLQAGNAALGAVHALFGTLHTSTSLLSKLPASAFRTMEAETAGFLADYIPRFEQEAGKRGPLHDAELVRELVVQRFTLVARECLAVSMSIEEFEAALRLEITRFVCYALSQYGWLTDSMLHELDTGFTFFAMWAKPWVDIPEVDRAKRWRPGAITSEALSHLALQLGAEARRRAAVSALGPRGVSEDIRRERRQAEGLPEGCVSASDQMVPRVPTREMDGLKVNERQNEEPADEPGSRSATPKIAALPSSPLFENPFPETDPRHPFLAPYFELMDEFRILRKAHPDFSIDWRASSALWVVGPPPRHGGQEIEATPAWPKYIRGIAGDAAKRLLCYSESRKQDVMRKWITPGRDRWLSANGWEPWEFWLYAIRDFWLTAREEAEASGADTSDFYVLAGKQGYLAGVSEAIGSRVWNVMISQVKSKSEAMKALGLSTFQEIGEFEDVAGRIEDGRITHAFEAFEYFCGVAAERRNRGLAVGTLSADENALRTVAESQLTFELLHFRYVYPEGFDAADQQAMEETRSAANRTVADKTITSHGVLSAIKCKWLSELASGAAPIFGHVASRLNWSANDRRNKFQEYIELAAASASMTAPTLRKFFQSPEWKELDRALFPPIATAVRQSKSSKRRGRLPGLERRQAIHAAVTKHGDYWREHLSEIFAELDSKRVSLGVFHSTKIDLGDGQSMTVGKWDDLDLAQGKDRERVIDNLRKYV